jgi:MoaA/NifB/PqqE/SkfB family radical SAM enzyme
MSRAVRAAERIGRAGYLARYMLGSVLGRKRALLGGIKLTHRCNLNCLHCPFWRREAGSLTFPQVISALRALHGLGVRIVILEGGEPFLWRDGGHDLRDVVAEAQKLFFSVGVTTNGTFPIETDADIVWVSVDGLQETHDRIRGETFERIMAHLEASTHPRIYAHVTINALNWREVPELVRFLAPRVRGVTVQFHYPYREVDRDLFLPFPDRRRVLDALIALKRQGLAVADSYACLEALKENRWRCRPWMIASVDPDGRVTHGCYVRGRGEVSCERCGFSAHAEISLAYGGGVEPILLGSKLFALW